MKRVLRIAGGIASSLVLALLPKCPVCMAAYLAMLTGFGVSVAVAAIIKTSLGTLSVLILVWLAATAVLRLVRKGGRHTSSPPVSADRSG